MGEVKVVLCGLLVAAGLLAGCGKQQHQQPSVPPASPTTGTLTVAQQGTAPAQTVWYARIESTDAKPLAEADYRGRPIELTRELPPGDYRVISWQRACEAECPATGEAGLGPLEEVCGTPVTITAGSRTTATVVIDPEEGTCTIHL